MTQQPTDAEVAEIEKRQRALPAAHRKQANTDVETLLAVVKSRQPKVLTEDESVVVETYRAVQESKHGVTLEQGIYFSNQFAAIIDRLTKAEEI